MTSSRMENPLWKKLQNDPALLKFQQQISSSNPETNNNLLAINEMNRNLVGIDDSNDNLQSLMTNTTAQLSPDSLNMLKQQQQLQSSSYASLLEHQNQQLHNLQQFINTQNSSEHFYQSDTSELDLNAYKMNNFYDSSYKSSNKQFVQQQRERGIIEKIVGSYGFVKCLDRDCRLFFHYSSFQAVDSSLKVNDLVEFEEGIDKRNGKPIAVNLSRLDKVVSAKEAALNLDAPLNLMNLKELLKNGNSADSSQFVQQQQSYQTIMNSLKMLNMQNNTETTANNLNSIMNLINKENIFNASTNQFNANILNMAKTASNSAQSNGNDNLANLAKMFNVNTTEMKQKNEEQMEGTVAIVATKRPVNNHYNSLSQQLDGRITYQRSGETFYIPYSLSDVVHPIQLRIGDRVKFYIAHLINNNLNQQQQLQLPVVSTYYARKVEIIQQDYMNDLAQFKPNKQVYRGIITTLKDSFGKVEREDVFKETFFHFSEYRGQNQELRLGLNVEFELQDRHGKEIACNIRMLPENTVCFDDLSNQVYIGRIIQPLTKINNNGTINSIGRLIYDGTPNNINNGESLVELSFTDRDRISSSGEYTFLEGDFVQFRIATDKRRKVSNIIHQRATQLTLIEEHSLVENSINTNEHRERGVLVKLFNAKDFLPSLTDTDNQSLKYGAIQCLDQNELVYFSLNEVINYVRFTTTNVTAYSINEIQLQIGDSLEFSVVKCQKDLIFKNGLKAIRLRQLAKNSVQFEIISTESYNGFIERESDLIRYSTNKNNQFQTIAFTLNDDQYFNLNDKVKFNICTCLKTNKQAAVNIKLVEAFKEQGIITLIKDTYGFIEIITQQKNNKQKTPREIVFNASSLTSIGINDLNIGDIVEFVINKKNRQNLTAENVIKLSLKKANQTKIYSNLSPTVHKGRITQLLKIQQSNQSKQNFDEQTQQQIDDSYFGKIQQISTSNERKDSVGSSNDSTIYQFGLFSLNDKKLVFQLGDLVSFQLGTCFDGSKKAFNLQLVTEQSTRQRNNNSNDLKKGKIESIKGHCGFIEYLSTNDDRKKVFFHISDLMEEQLSSGSESSNVKIGDEVEFILMHNSRSGKYSAVKIKKLPKSNSEPTVKVDPEAYKRPEHLITKLKLANIDDKSGKQLILIRQPNNPDSKTKSFSRQLFERLPGSLEPLPSKTSEQLSTESNSGESDELQQDLTTTAPVISPLSIIDLLMANSS